MSRNKLTTEVGATSVILPKNPHVMKIPINLAKDASFAEDELVAGTILAYDTANSKWVPYDGGGANGVDVAKGILAEGILKADYIANDIPTLMYVHGAFNPNECGDNLDANGMADLTQIYWTEALV